MRGSFYKLLGLFVWKAVLVYLHQKSPGRRRLALGGAAAVALVLLAGAGAKQLSSDDSAS